MRGKECTRENVSLLTKCTLFTMREMQRDIDREIFAHKITVMNLFFSRSSSFLLTVFLHIRLFAFLYNKRCEKNDVRASAHSLTSEIESEYPISCRRTIRNLGVCVCVSKDREREERDVKGKEK